MTTTSILYIHWQMPSGFVWIARYNDPDQIRAILEQYAFYKKWGMARRAFSYRVNVRAKWECK